MKKRVIVLLLTILLISFLVVAEENATSDETQEKNLSESIKNVTGKINITNIRNYETEFVLPDYIQKPTKFIFQIDSDDDIGIEYFIVLVMVFIIILVIITGTIYMTPLHRNPIELFIFNFNPDFIIGGIITLIVALTGVIDFVVSDWFFSFKLYKDLVDKMGSWSILVVIFILILLFFALKMLFKMLREKFMLEKAKYDGDNSRIASDMNEIQVKAMDEMAK